MLKPTTKCRPGRHGEMSTTRGDELAYHLNEAARLSRLSRASLYKLLASGELKSIKVAGRRLIPADALRSLLQPEVA
jgi:excisionase family DNA binding protein